MLHKTKKAILLLEVALVVLITAVISVFLFRGYNVFINAQRKSSAYLELTLESEKQLWELRSGNTANKNIILEDSGFKGLKKVTLNAESADKRYSFDTVCFMPVEEK